MKCNLVLILVITYATVRVEPSSGRSIVPKKGGYSQHSRTGVNNNNHGWPYAPYEERNEDSAVRPTANELNCKDYFVEHADSIIRTKDSLKAGAVFVSAPTVDTLQECMDACDCSGSDDDEERCDMMVFENVKKNCYLFHCMVDGVNACVFAHHDGYVSMLLDSSSFEKVKASAAEHVEDLGDLVGEPTEKVPLQTTSTTKTTTTVATIITSTTKKPKIHCARYEFECDNGECIEIRHACDGIPHCMDSSDENCNFDYSNPWFYYTMGNVNDKKPHSYEDYDYSILTNLPDEQNEENKNNKAGMTNSDDSSEEGRLISTKAPVVPELKGPKTTAYQPPNVAVKTDDVIQTTVGDNPTHNTAGNTPNKEETSTVVGKMKNTDTQDVNKTAKVDVEVDVAVKQMGSGRTVPETSAILPLAIGLAITLVLLIMVACRLRMVKRKLRYGRPLPNSQEADYLINGMYL